MSLPTIEIMQKQIENFQVAIGCDPDIDPQRAWHWFLKVSEHYEYPASDVEPRWFKVLLRPAGIDEQDFVDEKLATANRNNPVWCLKTTAGYTFFGAL